MCKICVKARKLSVQDALLLVGEAMEEASNERKIEHLSALLDELLGTELSDTDDELGDVWERSNREK